MKERPILFSGPMVRAILEGRKTMTRRVVKNGFVCPANFGLPAKVFKSGYLGVEQPCPYGQPGDRLRVRETARVVEHEPYGRVRVRYEADQAYGVAEFPSRLKPVPVGKCIANGCHREAARIFLEVTGVRVERLQDISEADAIAEGVQQCEGGAMDYLANDFAQGFSPRSSFRSLWESLNGAGSWGANPWVWVVEFKRVEGWE